MRKLLIILLYSGFCVFIAYTLLSDPKLRSLNEEGALLTLVLAGLLFTACLYGAIWNTIRLVRGPVLLTADLRLLRLSRANTANTVVGAGFKPAPTSPP